MRNIHLGPTLPAFLLPRVTALLGKTCGIGGMGEVDADLQALVASVAFADSGCMTEGNRVRTPVSFGAGQLLF